MVKKDMIYFILAGKDFLATRSDLFNGYLTHISRFWGWKNLWKSVNHGKFQDRIL
ncbi:hypothetical protein [Allomuricauda sp. CP2A]|uniref:hypothetical protein n=1 Tax=Allomuricauda sp. CP2A TaxID=1848189 RepID=UPI00159EC9A1|nr:hypothetical protein [Muricauda sp. CP2A]